MGQVSPLSRSTIITTPAAVPGGAQTTRSVLAVTADPQTVRRLQLKSITRGPGMSGGATLPASGSFAAQPVTTG